MAGSTREGPSWALRERATGRAETPPSIPARQTPARAGGATEEANIVPPAPPAAALGLAEDSRDADVGCAAAAAPSGEAWMEARAWASAASRLAEGAPAPSRAVLAAAATASRARSAAALPSSRVQSRALPRLFVRRSTSRSSSAGLGPLPADSTAEREVGGTAATAAGHGAADAGEGGAGSTGRGACAAEDAGAAALAG
mmetsp:Transcript_3632/g.15117  ORF Transcript_3632/g.15117 Transcript_3632/m.15117 type:complete len:200 (+) Transcript_3632:413-1012(+)